MKLNDLKDNPGARKSRMRVGRGEGSGKGKTCGRGQKGQGSRTGVSLNGFEGGQNPLYRRLPKRGFRNTLFMKVYTELNLGQIQEAIEKKKLDAKKVINHASLVEAGLIKPTAPGLKLLGNGELKQAVTLEVVKATASAREAVEKLQGKLALIG